jgi:hypothetical protein
MEKINNKQEIEEPQGFMVKDEEQWVLWVVYQE